VRLLNGLINIINPLDEGLFVFVVFLEND